jgi:hypothetical protein
MASSYLTRSSANSSGSGTTATISFWVRKNTEAPGDGGFFQAFTDGSNFCSVYANPTLKMRNYISGSYSSGDITCNRKLRDPAAWYHLQFVWDTTNNTAADRMRIYVNGVRETSFSSSTNPSSSYSFTPFVSGTIYVNRYNQNTTTADNNFSHFHYCDGYAYEPTSFGSTDTTTGEWKINASPNVQYGSNGFFIFKDGSSTTDQSGNSKTFTTTGTLTNTEDNPSNVFATGNPLYFTNSAWTTSLSNGNNTFTGHTGTNSYPLVASTIAAPASGKFYAEFKVTSSSQNYYVGVATPEAVSGTAINGHYPNWNNEGGSEAHAYSYYGADGQKYVKTSGGATSASAYGSASSQNDILGVALDLDNNKLYIHKNGTYFNSGVPTSGSTGTGAISVTNHNYLFFMSDGGGGSDASGTANFGNGYFGTTAISSEGTNASNIGKFEYDVPTGYTALSTKGLNE